MGKVERQDAYVLTDDVQVVLSKRTRTTDQDWPKYLPIYKSFNAYSWEYQTNFGGRIVATKRRAEALPAAQTDIPRAHLMLKFKDADAEAVMAKALEGGSDSEKEGALFPKPIPVPAPLEIPSEAMKNEMETSGNQVEKKHQVRSRKFSLQTRKHLRR